VASEVAVGTASGSVVVYSTKVGDYKEVAVHEGKVNDVCWSSDGQRVFSASDDGHVGCIDAKKLSVAYRFMPEGDRPKREALHSIVLAENSSILVGGAARILWLDLDTKSVLRVLVGGHVGYVTALALLPLPRAEPLLFSAGAGDKDRAVAVWRLERVAGQAEMSPETSLGVNETVAAVSASLSATHDDDGDLGDVVVTCVSLGGVLRLFEFDPNAKRKKIKTLRPKATVQVAAEKDAKGRVAPIPVLAANWEQSTVRLVHGSATKPIFETLKYAELDKNTCLVRQLDESKKEGTPDYGVKLMVRSNVVSAHLTFQLSLYRLLPVRPLRCWRPAPV